MKKNGYAWARPGFYKDIDPNVAGEHLEMLVDHYNEHLTADEVLADARKRTSPINSAFEWDDSAAAEKFRKRQAKMLMQSLCPVKNGKKQKTRAFVFVRHSRHERKVYMPVRSALGRPDMRDQLIANAIRSLTQWVSHYGSQREMRFLRTDVKQLQATMQRQLMAMV